MPQRRRSGDEYTSTPTKVNALSPNYITPLSSSANTGSNTPLHHHNHSHSHGHHHATAGASSSRKRPKQDYQTPSSSHSKKNRGKKQRSMPTGRKMTSDSDEAETLEKRNLHNDMERQRRIGLKNLFEQLKREIPSIRDKERAPKVNILREAAALCNKLNREQQQRDALIKQQTRLYARVRQLRSSLHSQRRLD
jgi:Myc proto-oncogene protein